MRPHHEERASARPSLFDFVLVYDPLHSMASLFVLRFASELCHKEADCMVQGACDATGTMGHDYSALGGFNGMGPVPRRRRHEKVVVAVPIELSAKNEPFWAPDGHRPITYSWKCI